jgi:hypothetical protein
VSQGRVPLSQTESAKDSGHYRCGSLGWRSVTIPPLKARVLVAMTESLGMRLNQVDRIQLGRLLTAAGHELKLSCEKMT